MVDAVLALPQDTRLMILAPVAREKKGEFLDVFAEMLAQGYVRFRVNGVICEYDALPSLKKTEKLHEFLSPLANQRSDHYGGSLENRMRYVLEVFAAVRAAYAGSLGVRISASDWVEGGWDVAQSTALAHALQPLGCDFIHVSSGGVSPLQKISIGPGYQLPFAHAIRAATALPTTAVGLITDAAQAEAVLQQGDADLVALARAFLYNPRWGWHAAAALGGEVQGFPAYWRCLPREAANVFGKVTVGMR
jgi:NADPH2 dehydrogenase